MAHDIKIGLFALEFGFPLVSVQQSIIRRLDRLNVTTSDTSHAKCHAVFAQCKLVRVVVDRDLLSRPHGFGAAKRSKSGQPGHLGWGKLQFDFSLDRWRHDRSPGTTFNRW